MESGKRPPGIHENPFREREIAENWIKLVEIDPYRARFIYPMIAEWLKQPGIKDVLDIGAGEGSTIKLCEGKNYVGLEPSAELRNRAIELFGDRGRFLDGSAYKIPAEDKSFDAALAVMVWFHLKDLRRASLELHRVLKDSGRALIINPNSDEYDLWKSWYTDITEFKGGFEGRVEIPKFGALSRNIFYTHPRDKIIGSLNKAGLAVVDSQKFGPNESGQNIFESFSVQVKN